MDGAATGARSYGALGDVVRILADIHGSILVPVTVVAMASAVSAFAEAAALVAFVAVAVSITSNDSDVISVAGWSITAGPGLLLAASAALAILTAAGHVAAVRSSSRLSLRVALNARTRLINSLMEAPWSVVAAQREGRFQDVATGAVQRLSRSALELASAASALIALVVFVLAALLTAPSVSLGLLSFLIVIGLLLRPILTRLRAQASAAVGAGLNLAEAIAKAKRMARELFVFGVRRQQAQELVGVAADASRRAVETARTHHQSSFLVKDLALLGLILLVGGLYVLGDLSSAAVAAAALLVIRALVYLQQALRSLQLVVEGVPTALVVSDELRELERRRESSGEVSIDSIGTIHVDGVSYSYPGLRCPALNNVSLRLEPLTTVGLIGASGAGKTTLAEILLGLRAPEGGSVKVDGLDLHSVRRVDWRRLTAMLPQEPHLMDGSIANNIRFLRPWITEDDVRKAARLAHIDEEILALSNGFDTILGPGGQGLSVGQRQRVALARALADRPQLLVLDEPTSAVDGYTEELLGDTIRELTGSMTMLVITHRPTTLAACDLTVSLSHGQFS